MSKEEEKRNSPPESHEDAPPISDHELYSFHEKRAGRLVIDLDEARIEFGEAFAKRLKTAEDGKTILWPQPTPSARDPQNWSKREKSLQLLIITLAAIVPDFDSGIGIASIFALAEEYNTTPNNINNLTSNWSIFLLGWGGLAAVMLIRRFGRLPVLFWSQVWALGWLVGCTFAPDLKTFAAMRCLTAFFGTAPQVTGLYTVTDLYPFHLQARKLNLWTMGFIISPFLSPWLFGYTVAETTWRWAYGAGCLYGLLVVVLITFWGKETMYDRTVDPIPEPQTTGLRYRVETLIGITGLKMAKYRPSWAVSILAPLNVLWRPHILTLLFLEMFLFGFGIGINVTNAVFLGEPAPLGFGLKQIGIATCYLTPVIAVFIGELTGRYMNDFIQNWSIRRNKGVFEAEARLWALYPAIILNIVGYVLLGAALQKHLHIAALILGWGIAEVSIMIGTVSVYAYCNDSFPKHQGEISALINLVRVLGGFSVAYFQVPWAGKNGALQTFGCETAIVCGLFLLIVPFLQLKGAVLREKYSLH
ncbi:MFS general substrate transporter [Flagelloscypha sp. PMI_526]|nr:MFS general substrate transporter [Flagelloscypha sp. PMI_526]